MPARWKDHPSRHALVLYLFSALPDLSLQPYQGLPCSLCLLPQHTSQLPPTSSGAPCGANQGSDGGCYQEAHSYLETPGIYIRLSHPGLSFLCPAPSMKSESLCPRGWGLWKPRLGDELPHLEISCAWGLGCMFTFGGLHGYSLLAVCRHGRMRGSHSQRRATRPASCSMLP